MGAWSIVGGGLQGAYDNKPLRERVRFAVWAWLWRDGWGEIEPMLPGWSAAESGDSRASCED